MDIPSCEWKELYSYVCNDIVSDCNDRDSFTVTMDVIINAIRHLKPVKSDGCDGLSTDYFINGSPLLSEYLSCLFTCMLSHCFIPTLFSVSTRVSIPKGSNKDLTNIKNYRGIALSSLISKLFDNCIISSNSYMNPMIYNLLIRRKHLLSKKGSQNFGWIKHGRYQMKSRSNEQLHFTMYKMSIARQNICCKCTARHSQKLAMQTL